MFWFYFIAWVIGIGAMVNRVWKETRDMNPKLLVSDTANEEHAAADPGGADDE
jgi:uncharacterized BrkB/YihY/UPF0761 family membrane protein